MAAPRVGWALGVALGAFAFAPTGLVRSAEPTDLWEMRVELGDPEPSDWSEPLRAALYVADPAGLAASLAAAQRAEVQEERVIVELGAYPRLTDPPRDAHREPSFVLDFDAPAVRELSERLRSAHGGRPSIAALIEFADATIETKTRTRAFDLPSQIARHRSGDCTEHAVLLAALARSVGVPARVVTGAVILRTGESLRAYGHAWAELHDGERWLPADAALPEAPPAADLRYLRLQLLESEGPEYRLALVRFDWRPRRIEILAAKSPGAAPHGRPPAQTPVSPVPGSS